MEEHHARGMLLANILYTPPILIAESSDSLKEDLCPRSANWSIKVHKRVEVREKATKMLQAMNVTFKGEIRIAEEAIAVGEVPVNLNPHPRRACNSMHWEVEELAVVLPSIRLLLAQWGSLGVPKTSSLNEAAHIEHPGIGRHS
ncbi:hypothetical protein AMTR_s00012p00209820 [Amborella trichopoda]|uniref:Uncharacterized protein n=1 Tax=Amborella trichopoda TaxID=13333 RepID=W1PJD6_AMBTC|nr:hypothetical protein AMTR_s00012p00209820 [Amborella trichopoda]